MITQLKNIVKKNENLYGLYKKARFIKNISHRDFFNFKKLLLFKKVYPYTMLSWQRLSNAYELALQVEKDNLKGAFVECGVWKGGCAGVMAYALKESNSKRKTWLFDSFEGLPEPTKKDGKMAEDYAKNKSEGKLETIDKCVGPMKDVKKLFFEILKINPENVVIEKGWFQDTLPLAKNKIGDIAILRLDGDWYESTKCCFQNLYDNVVVKGYVIIDDYGYWEGARKAAEEFFSERNIKPELIKIDSAGVYFKKP
ncbi:MAG: class I SAM-dependent methyltransferase [Candidatus Staskawiczbacteria bacterium]|nr:class I SAM-dependent methyltransferase [Candidatus Staskawiczbacteria bacterium]